MLKIIYVDGITDWIKINDLREMMYKVKSKGGKLELNGNFSTKCQMALLKTIEECSDVKIVTSHRLLSTIESRGKVQGSCRTNIFSSLLGLYEINQRAAMRIADLIRTRQGG